MIRARVATRLVGMTAVRNALRTDSAVAKRVMRKWTARLRSFLYRRFDIFSKGGGDWKPLAESTLRARRRRGNTSTIILRDTSQMFLALNPSVDTPGAMLRSGPWSIQVGMGTGQKHGDGPNTVADIASFHQSGGGHLPQRKIIVPPTEDVRRAMAQDAIFELAKFAQEQG